MNEGDVVKEDDLAQRWWRGSEVRMQCKEKKKLVMKKEVDVENKTMKVQFEANARRREG